jgi:hypothetical protein
MRSSTPPSDKELKPTEVQHPQSHTASRWQIQAPPVLTSFSFCFTIREPFLILFYLFFFFAEVGKTLFVKNLFVQKRRERLHIGECRGTRKPVIPAFLNFSPASFFSSSFQLHLNPLSPILQLYINLF